MPRIAFISSTFPDYQKCGIGIYAGYLCQALAQQGHDVHVVTTAIPEIRNTFGKVTVHKIMESWNPMDMPKLVRLFHQIQPELIHINHPTAIAAQKTKILVNMLPEANRHLWKLPLITTLHEFNNVSWLGKMKMYPFLMLSDAITVTNERYRQKVCQFIPESRHKRVHAVNIGTMFEDNLPLGERIEQKAKWGLSPDDQVIGFFGFITPPKGFHNLIEAAAPLMRENRKMKILALSSWNLSSSLYRQKILDQIEKEGITGQVIFTGFLKDQELWEGLSAIDLCVFPFDEPVEERSSGPLRQAVYRGLPTVVFAEDIHYSEFGFQHGENIWFTPHMNKEILRQDILKLLADRELRQKISNGAKSLRSEFSFDTVSNSMSRLYSQVLALPSKKALH